MLTPKTGEKYAVEERNPGGKREPDVRGTDLLDLLYGWGEEELTDLIKRKYTVCISLKRCARVQCSLFSQRDWRKVKSR